MLLVRRAPAMDRRDPGLKRRPQYGEIEETEVLGRGSLRAVREIAALRGDGRRFFFFCRFAGSAASNSPDLMPAIAEGRRDRGGAARGESAYWPSRGLLYNDVRRAVVLYHAFCGSVGVVPPAVRGGSGAGLHCQSARTN